MRYVFLVMILVLVTVGLSAQATTPAEQKQSPEVVTQDPATREELQKAMKEMKKVVLDAGKKSAEESAKKAASLVEAERLRNEAQRLEAEKKLRDDMAEAEKNRTATAVKERLAREDRERNQLIGMAIGFGLVCLGLVWLIRRSIETKVEKLTIVEKVPQVDKDGTLTNPEVSELREYAERKNASEVHFKLVLPKKGTAVDGRELDCVAEFKDSTRHPMIRFIGDSGSVAWDKRMQRAAILAAKQLSETKNSITH